MLRVQQKLVVLFWLLYYLQGIPYGIQIKSLPLYSLDVLNYPIESVTQLSLLMSPWIFFKPIIVCCVDITRHFSFLLFLSIFANVFLSIVLYGIFSSNFAYLSFFHLLPFFFMNCFTVLLDVCTDQLAIVSALSSSDITFFGISNSIQIVAYKFGASFSELVLHSFGYDNMSCIFLIQSVVYFAVGLYTYELFKKNWKKIMNIDPKCYCKTAVNVTELFNRTFFLKTNSIFVIYLLLYKIGESGALTLSPLLMYERSIDRGAITQLSTVICEPLSLAGSILGGYLLTFYKETTLSLIDTLVVFSLLRMIPLLIQFFVFNSYFSLDSYMYEISLISLPILSFLGGTVSTLTFTVMMIVACMTGKNSYAPYSYSLFASVEVFGKLLFSSCIGSLCSLIGKSPTYAIFCLCNLIASYLLRTFKSELFCSECQQLTVNKCK